MVTGDTASDAHSVEIAAAPQGDRASDALEEVANTVTGGAASDTVEDAPEEAASDLLVRPRYGEPATLRLGERRQNFGSVDADGSGMDGADQGIDRTEGIAGFAGHRGVPTQNPVDEVFVENAWQQLLRTDVRVCTHPSKLSGIPG